ncbi:MAG: alpha/beta fold hydrolase [Janthinobacterium lividum]
MRNIRTPVLDIAFEGGGPPDGRPVLLLHGWPDDATAWRGVAPALEAAGMRWVAPWLRGFGATRFLSASTLRDGSGVAIAQDALDLADALGWGRFAVVGHDWGGRAAYILAALAPERVTSIASLAIGYAPRGRFAVPGLGQSRRWWYQWFMATDGGAQAVRDDPVDFARMQWDTWGPTAWFDEAAFAAVAGSFRDPDWAAVTLHGYRSRWMAEALDPRYAGLREKVDACEVLPVPTLMIQGAADLCDPPAESEGQERFFANGYRRLVLDGVGHFPAREDPRAVGEAVVAHLGESA